MKTILLVEDDEDVREMVDMSLTDAGYEVRTATNGREALAQLDEMRDVVPCLVLLDIMMPEMSGLELLTELKSKGRLLDLPVVVLSAQAHEAKGMGARKLVRKPVSLEFLLSLVRETCGEP